MRDDVEGEIAAIARLQIERQRDRAAPGGVGGGKENRPAAGNHLAEVDATLVVRGLIDRVAPAGQTDEHATRVARVDQRVRSGADGRGVGQLAHVHFQAGASNHRHRERRWLSHIL